MARGTQVTNKQSLFGESLSSLHFFGQLHMDMVQDTPYFFSPDSYVDSGVNLHIWSYSLFHDKFIDFFECLRGTLETHSMNVLVNVDGVFSGHNQFQNGPSSCHPSLQVPFCQAQVRKEVFQVSFELFPQSFINFNPTHITYILLDLYPLLHVFLMLL